MSKEEITIIHIVIFADTIMEYFHKEIGGFAGDFAWYELLLNGETYLKKRNKSFENNLKFVFNIKKKDIQKIMKIYKDKMKEIKKLKGFLLEINN